MKRSLILSASNSCFVACPGCYNHFGGSVADSDGLLRFIRALRDNLALRKITVGGGDPLTRPDIVDLLRSVHDLGLRAHLDTVGTAFIRDARIRFMGRGTAPRVDAAEVAALVELIGIPLDGSTDEVSQRFRRFSAVEDQMLILATLAKINASVCVNTVVHAGNVDDLPAIAQIISGFNMIREWQLFQFMPIGPLGYRNRDRFEIGRRSFDDAVDRLRDLPLDSVKIRPKGASDRKHRYLLVDSSGVVWIPRQQQHPDWNPGDTNSDRVVLGSIYAHDILERIVEVEL